MKQHYLRNYLLAFLLAGVSCLATDTISEWVNESYYETDIENILPDQKNEIVLGTREQLYDYPVLNTKIYKR